MFDIETMLKEWEDNAKELVSNTEYITWLNNFTKEHLSFSDDDWLYCPEKISTKDNKFVKQLYLLYQGIKTYAIKNYIYPIKCDSGEFYKIQYDGIGYEIGRLVGQGTLLFCRRVKIENDKEFIDFNYIMNNKEQDNVKDIKAKLEYLSKAVISAHECGVPIDAIWAMLGDTVNKIEQGETL